MSERKSGFESRYLPRRILIILLGFTTLRLLLVFLFPVFGDACRYFLMARAISEDPFLLTREGVNYPNPLFLLLGACFYRLFSIVDRDLGFLGISFISPICGSLTILTTYLICKKILSRREQFYTLLLLGLSPSHLLFSSVGYMESLFLLFVTLAIYFILKDSPTTNRSIIMSGLSLGLASLTRVTGFLILIALILYILTRKKLPATSTRLRLSAVLIGCVLIIAGPYYGRQLYEFGVVEMIGQVLPPQEGAVTLDSLIYRTEIKIEMSEALFQGSDYNPWFRIIGTFFEFWGIWGGAVNVLFRPGVLGSPLIVFGGFTSITLFLSFFHIYGGLTLKGKQEYSLLHLCVVLLFLAFFAVIISQYLRQGWISASLGYRKPLISVAPILAIYGGYGLNQAVKRLEGKRLTSIMLKSAVAVSLLLLLLAVVFEGLYMRERYETTLLGAAEWLKENKSQTGAVLTTRSMEIAYLADRRTMSLSLIAPQAVSKDLFITHSISHVLVPIKEFTQNRSLDPYLVRFKMLEDEGILREIYRDPGAFVLEVILDLT